MQKAIAHLSLARSGFPFSFFFLNLHMICLLRSPLGFSRKTFAFRRNTFFLRVLLSHIFYFRSAAPSTTAWISSLNFTFYCALSMLIVLLLNRHSFSRFTSSQTHPSTRTHIIHHLKWLALLPFVIVCTLFAPFCCCVNLNFPYEGSIMLSWVVKCVAGE